MAAAPGSRVRTVATDALKDFWHPVAFSSDLTTAPRRVEVLGEQLAVYRTATGRPVALRDLCIHRGTPLSLGWVEGELLTCAYHGWTYDPAGICVRIPSVEPGRSIPTKARVDAYHVRECYGLVWVCLGEPRDEVADFPEFADKSFRTYYQNQEDWAASAARLIENFVDTAHFAWVHPGLLGDRDRPRVPPISVAWEGLRIQVALTMESSGGFQTGVGSTTIWDEITLPFTVRQVRTDGRGGRNVIFLAVCPTGPRTLRRFVRSMRDYDLDRPHEPFVAQSEVVQSQDRAIVEEQRPEELPVDLSEEMHVRGPDDPAVVYRRALRSLGVEPDEPAPRPEGIG